MWGTQLLIVMHGTVRCEGGPVNPYLCYYVVFFFAVRLFMLTRRVFLPHAGWVRAARTNRPRRATLTCRSVYMYTPVTTTGC